MNDKHNNWILKNVNRFDYQVYSLNKEWTLEEIFKYMKNK